MTDDSCSQCHGTGKIRVTQEHEDTETVTEHEVTCGWCGGTGRK